MAVQPGREAGYWRAKAWRWRVPSLSSSAAMRSGSILIVGLTHACAQLPQRVSGYEVAERTSRSAIYAAAHDQPRTAQPQLGKSWRQQRVIRRRAHVQQPRAVPVAAAQPDGLNDTPNRTSAAEGQLHTVGFATTS